MVDPLKIFIGVTWVILKKKWNSSDTNPANLNNSDENENYISFSCCLLTNILRWRIKNQFIHRNNANRINFSVYGISSL